MVQLQCIRIQAIYMCVMWAYVSLPSITYHMIAMIADRKRRCTAMKDSLESCRTLIPDGVIRSVCCYLSTYPVRLLTIDFNRVEVYRGGTR